MKAKSIFENKVFKILFPLLMAFGLWLYVVMVVSPGSEATIYNVPVSIPSQKILWQRGVMITSDTDLTVDVKLAGNRRDLNNLDKSDITVEVDLSSIYDAGTHEALCNVRVPGNVTAQADPGFVKLVVVERLEKKIPITVKFIGSTPDSYIKGKEVLSREEIIVTGPKAFVNTVAEAVVTVDLTGHNADIEETLPIVLVDRQGTPVNGLTIMDENAENEISEVSVQVPIVMYKEIPLVVELTAGGGATEENTKVELSETTISISGPEAILANMDELVVGSIDLAEVMESGEFEFDIKLPQDVMNETGITKVTATVTLPELMTYTFLANQIRYENLPEGLNADLVAKVVEVTVRGSAALVSQMSKEDITVMVDLTGATVGTERYNAKILFSAIYQDVGVLGEYMIPATITEKK